MVRSQWAGRRGSGNGACGGARRFPADARGRGALPGGRLILRAAPVSACPHGPAAFAPRAFALRRRTPPARGRRGDPLPARSVRREGGGGMGGRSNASAAQHGPAPPHGAPGCRGQAPPPASAPRRSGSARPVWRGTPFLSRAADPRMVHPRGAPWAEGSAPGAPGAAAPPIPPRSRLGAKRAAVGVAHAAPGAPTAPYPRPHPRTPAHPPTLPAAPPTPPPAPPPAFAPNASPQHQTTTQNLAPKSTTTTTTPKRPRSRAARSAPPFAVPSVRGHSKGLPKPAPPSGARQHPEFGRQRWRTPLPTPHRAWCRCPAAPPTPWRCWVRGKRAAPTEGGSAARGARLAGGGAAGRPARESAPPGRGEPRLGQAPRRQRARLEGASRRCCGEQRCLPLALSHAPPRLRHCRVVWQGRGRAAGPRRRRELRRAARRRGAARERHLERVVRRRWGARGEG
jgi:hypothetical protein